MPEHYINMLLKSEKDNIHKYYHGEFEVIEVKKQIIRIRRNVINLPSLSFFIRIVEVWDISLFRPNTFQLAGELWFERSIEQDGLYEMKFEHNIVAEVRMNITDINQTYKLQDVDNIVHYLFKMVFGVV